MRTLIVIGTRPEAIKLAPVVWELVRQGHAVRVCLTGQHNELVAGALRTFRIHPDYSLGIMRPRQTPSDVLSRALIGLQSVIDDEHPDWVIVQGDTTSALAAAIATFYSPDRPRLAHVEAGLRSGDKWAPFPEENHRRLIGILADLHCAPTEWARGNLIREGFPAEAIAVTGNTSVDAIRWAIQQPCPDLELPNRRIITVTLHRREIHGAKLRAICRALSALARRYWDVEWIFPVHPNPNVRAVILAELAEHTNFRLIEPLDYIPMAHLIARSYCVLTDSGGLQEEAPSLGVPVLVLRDRTERPEGVQAGVARVLGTGREAIIAGVAALMDDPAERDRMAQTTDIYGDGHAAERIVAALTR